ncbi:hypothetical protein RB200_24775 [Streptomyces sp. PmtG]
MTAHPARHRPHGPLPDADPGAAPAAPDGPVGREATRRGLALVRAYASGDSAAIATALDSADPAVRAQLPSVTGDLLRLVVGVVLSGPRTFTPDDVVRTADRIAAAAPPHHELAATQAVRAWAHRGDAQPPAAWRGADAGPHGTAVLAASLAVTAWGEGPLLGLLAAFDDLAGTHA